jgi:multiple sugar transport system substrate-binding protein
MSRAAFFSRVQLPYCRSAARAAPDGVRWVWWGNPERNRRTAAALKLFDAQYPEIKVTSESAAWPDYWPKVATEVAGRHAADVIQIDYRFLVEYARRGALFPLEGLMPKPLNLSGFDQSETSTGMVDGKLYGVSVGGNAFAYLYNRAVFTRLGIPEPKPGWTWNDFTETAGAISKASTKGFWGAGDGSRQDDVLAAFLRQRGKNFFKEDGQLLRVLGRFAAKGDRIAGSCYSSGVRTTEYKSTDHRQGGDDTYSGK